MAGLSAGAGFKAPLWPYFEDICSIPHGSGNEDALAEYILAFAEKHGLEARRDAVGSVVVSKPGSPGYEDHPALVLQGHLDMVCEKNDGTVHDFEKDPIRILQDGDWLKGDGTTLGADNGVGVAAALAVLADKKLEHPPLEALFTVDEETGLNGAMGLTPDIIRGRRLINMDSEEEGIFYFGCAGGRNTSGKRKLQLLPAPGDNKTVALRVEGLFGGHSGGEIHRHLGNAIQLGAQVIFSSCIRDMQLVSLRGGGKHNAIPREFEAVFSLPEKALEALKKEAEVKQQQARRLYTEDGQISISVRTLEDAPSGIIEGGADIIRGLLSIPHGVVEMSPLIKGVVETSTNLAAVQTEDASLYILTSQRSAVEFKRDFICNKVRSAMELLGCEVEYESEYPAWEPKPDSPLLSEARRIYHEVHGREPVTTVIHAGLECGVIDSKIKGMDMISFGPDIRGPHSPNEKVSIPSTERFWNYLLILLRQL